MAYSSSYSTPCCREREYEVITLKYNRKKKKKESVWDCFKHLAFLDYIIFHFKFAYILAMGKNTSYTGIQF